MQGGDRAPGYPGIAGGMGLCESTLPQLGRALRPQEKGNDVGWLVYVGQRKGEMVKYPHYLGGAHQPLHGRNASAHAPTPPLVDAFGV